jgi:hypothetical protein
MGDVAKSVPASRTGNTVTLQKVRVMFQVYPGIAGDDSLRGIPDVPYTFYTKQNGKIISTNGKTAKDGGLEFSLPIDAKGVVKIFDTVYAFPVVGRMYSKPNERVGVIDRLRLLGYTLEDDGGVGDALTLIEFQADSSIHANGEYDDKDGSIAKALIKAFGE